MNKEMKAPQNKRSAVKPEPIVLNHNIVRRGTVQPERSGKQRWDLWSAVSYLRKKKFHVIDNGDKAAIKVAYTHHMKGMEYFKEHSIVIDHATMEGGVGISTWGCVDYLVNFHGYDLYNVTIKNPSAQ